LNGDDLCQWSASMRKPKSFKFLPLPPNFNPVDATVEEVASFRRESIWTTFEKIRDGRYDAYLDGRVRKVVFASCELSGGCPSGSDRER
jgi:hypothetical protein